jgi:hypothetical protein
MLTLAAECASYRELQRPQGSLRQVLKFRPQRSQKWLGSVLRSQK